MVMQRYAFGRASPLPFERAKLERGKLLERHHTPKICTLALELLKNISFWVN
jgi:hypothetical protein